MSFGKFLQVRERASYPALGQVRKAGASSPRSPHARAARDNMECAGRACSLYPSWRPRLVAQICNLLYRRVALGRTWNCLCAQQHSGARRLALRRLQICDTAECNSALRAWILKSWNLSTFCTLLIMAVLALLHFSASLRAAPALHWQTTPGGRYAELPVARTGKTGFTLLPPEA